MVKPLTWLQSQKFQVVVVQILKKMEGMCFASISFFLFVHVLGNAHIHKHLEKCHLPRQVLTNLFATTISESYKQEMRRQKLKRKDFQKILEESTYYQNEQTWELQLKSRRRAKCSSTKCDKDLKSDFLCLCVSGTLSVPYQLEKAGLAEVLFFVP